jgi:hypothetical protein
MTPCTRCRDKLACSVSTRRFGGFDAAKAPIAVIDG